LPLENGVPTGPSTARTMLSFSSPFTRLALHVELDHLRREVDGFPPHLWSPDRLSGVAPSSYTMLALVSHRGHESDIMSGPFVATPYLESCPYIRQILASFEAPICEVRLRWLGPRSLGRFHFDRHRLLEDRYRVHVPIYTTPHARFYCGDRNVHMPAGTIWTFDRMRRHAVFNDDLSTARLSRDIAQKIQESLQYPGQIKVTVIRETRAVEYAK